MNIRKWLWIAGIMGCPILTVAQNISLKDLIDKVTKNAPALSTAEATIKVREAQVKDTKWDRLPALRLNYQATIGTNNNVEGAYFTYGLVPSSSGGVRAESNTGAVGGDLAIANLEWEVYNFGAFEAKNHAAAAQLTAEKSKYRFTEMELQDYAIQYYFKLVRLRQLMVIQQRNIERNQSIKQSIMSLANAGLNAGVDTSIAEAELSKARLNYLEVEDQYKQVQIHLATLSGTQAAELVPDTLVGAKLDAANPALLLNSVDTVSHPLIQYYQSLYQSNLAQEKVVRRSYNPKIWLEGTAWTRGSSIKYNDDFQSLGNGFNPTRPNYLVGVAISYNLLDIVHTRLKVQTQKSITEVSKRQFNEQQLLLNEEMANANQQVQTARQRLNEIPNQLSAANDAYRQKLNLYQNGLVNIVDVNYALNVLYRAETDNILAKDSYYKSLFKMAYATNQVATLLNLLNQ